MTLAEENRVQSFVGRDGGRWVPMPLWKHRILAMILRGYPDDVEMEDLPIYKRAVAARERRLARWSAEGRHG